MYSLAQSLKTGQKKGQAPINENGRTESLEKLESKEWKQRGLFDLNI